MKSTAYYLKLYRVPSGIRLFLILGFLPLGGCASIPMHEVPVLPAPVTQFPPVKPAQVRLPVNVTFPDGGDVLQHLANLVKGEIKQLAQVAIIKTKLKDLWKEIEQPVLLEKDIWLMVHPESLSIGMRRTDLKLASSNRPFLEMTAHPEIVFGPQPAVTPMPMPPLQPFKPGPPIFDAMSNSRITYPEANQILQDPHTKLVGMELKGSGARKLTLEGIRLYGSGGKVIVEVKLAYNPILINLSGKPSRLTLYLRGTPRFLPEERVVDLPDLDFDVKSNDLMVRIARWIFDSDLKDQLRKVTRIPLGPKIDALKARVNIVLNKQLGRNIRLTTRVNSLRMLDGFADNEGIEARISIRGTATMNFLWD